MGYKHPISLIEREKQLKMLIEDANKMDFEPCLIRGYEKQLKEVQEEIQDNKKVKGGKK